ncbi:Pimeloyl-ACP methyl ester carboxylesterase [Reichenbachiella faecimaris]|uniref:Pimeloyl-ACP methyl ester carboxylesterase n=1 Tax=Reichenbachiella faecimaris TaxID=692418 RepID=A0A1W2GMN9_REIFA|nr:alpha/beta hydrolase [Reichenbachiella faecimaris]SMD37935.1 Pimeloyl-ACP methyl ester carboxylesterase [Reichenbachiella faecimaris]
MRLPATLLILIIVMTGNATFAQSPTKVSDAIAEYKYPVKYVEVDGNTQIAYVDEGEGVQTLLFIHGLATYLPSWYKNIDALKSEYRCVAIDLPGYGRSTKGNTSNKMSDYADVVLKVIDQLELNNVVLVGHSMGGQVAGTTVLKSPDQFEKLILLAPAGFETFKSEQAAWLKTVFTVESVEEATEEQIRANWALNFYNLPADVEFMIQDRLKMMEAEDFNDYCKSVVGGMNGMLDEPIFDQLKNIKQTTLVVYGANDGLIPNQYLNPGLTIQMVGENGAGQIPKATLKFIPECGHFISFDKPEEINEILIEFLSN